MAHKIERRKIKDHDIILVFQFEDIGPLKPYSADTWISVKNWTNIYEQLDDFVNDPKDISNNSQLAFELLETPFTCSVSWSDISEPLGVAVCLFLSHCDKKKGKYKLPGFISIHVTNSISSKIFTEIASLRKEISTLKYELKKSKSSSSSSRSGGGGGCKTRSQSSRTRSHKPEQASKKPLSNAANSDGTQYTIEKADADHEEYVPNAVRRDNTLLEAGIKYEPGKVAESSKGQSHVVIANAEKYVPPQVSPVLSGKPKYIPSSASSSKSEPPPGRSSTRSGHPKIPNDHHKKTDARRNNGPKESNRKRGHSPDLFGTDDESSATQRCQDAAKPSHRVMPKREVPPTKAHRDPSNDRKKRTVLQSSNSQPKMNAIKPSNAVVDTTRPKLMSSEELKKFMDTRDEAISEMNKLSEMMRPEVLPDVEVVTLKHIRPDDLEKMFEEHRLDLKLMFDNYRKQTDYIVKKPKDLSAFCLNYLLDDKQQIKMMDVLSNEFGGAEEHTVYNDLFWKLLMPEWTLAMFMALYGFNRSAATERMRLQEKIVAAQYKMEDSMSIDFEDDHLEKKFR